MNKETEAIFYAKIGNPEGLATAERKIKQVQMECTIDENRRQRVRYEQEGSNPPVYTYTTKVFKNTNEDLKECLEHDTIVSKEFCDTFEPIADRMVAKTRYVFPAKDTTITLPDGQEIALPDVNFEVDVYKVANGTGTSSYCRVEVELQEIFAKLEEAMPDYDKANFNISLKDLPFEPSDYFNAEQATDEQKAIIDSLWREWAIPLNTGEETESAEEPQVENTEEGEGSTNVGEPESTEEPDGGDESEEAKSQEDTKVEEEGDSVAKEDDS